VRVRQPLAEADVVVSDAELTAGIRAHLSLIAEELNVKNVRLLAPGEEAGFVKYTLKPNFRALGPKLGKKVQACKAALGKADAGKLRTELATSGSTAIDVEGETISLGPEEVEVSVEAAEGFAAAGGRTGVVVLKLELDDALRDEGLAREVLAKVQQLRKDAGLAFTDRIALHIEGSERIVRVATSAASLLASEALAEKVSFGNQAKATNVDERAFSVDGEELRVRLDRTG
jgi:isoleucyl-tRNA synthetase